MYYGARFYDPTLGIFLAPDTLVPEPGDPQSLNRYSYTLNNPLKLVDPSGHQGVPPWFFYSVYKWLAMQFGYPDTEQLGVPALDGLTADVGKAWGEGLTAYSEVVGTAADTGLSLMPGGGTAYDLTTAATGQNIVGEKQPPVVRGMLVIGIFTPIDEVVPIIRDAGVVGKTEAHHWIPQALQTEVQRYYPTLGRHTLDFTDPLAEGFHKLVHGKGGTVVDAYNYTVEEWLATNGTTKGLTEFIDFIMELRAQYLELYLQYLTGG